MVSIDWAMASTIMTIVVIPVISTIVGLIFRHYDKKSEKRQEAQKKFHELSMDSWEKTGNVVVANANIALDGQSEANCRDLKDALKEYNSFREDVKKFKRDQTVGTLRN